MLHAFLLVVILCCSNVSAYVASSSDGVPSQENALETPENVIGVMLGSTLGHAACTLLAVAGGKLVADHISIRTVTLFGALLFIAFSFSSFVGAMNETLPSTVS